MDTNRELSYRAQDLNHKDLYVCLAPVPFDNYTLSIGTVLGTRLYFLK